MNQMISNVLSALWTIKLHGEILTIFKHVITFEVGVAVISTCDYQDFFFFYIPEMFFN